jgi:hypothetical protein
MKLQKLKNASFEELRERAAQKVSALSERHGWSELAKLPTDSKFAELLNSEAGNSASSGSDSNPVLFGLRFEAPFFPGLNDPQRTSDTFKTRWPDMAQRLIAKADRIVEGKFDLLGFTQLSFGDPIDWHLEPISGKRTPLVHWSKLDYLNPNVAGDKKVTWEVNRHQYFVTLGQAYWLTGDERYARTVNAHLDSWMDANPPKLGINWTSSLEVAFRSMSWLWAFYLFRSSLNSETLKRAWKFFYLNARHLESYLSTYFSPNTHITGEALGLFFLGTLLPEFKDAKRWQELGSRILVEQLSTHVQSDGVYFEQTSHYHRYTTDFYLQFLLLARANHFDLPRQVEESLALLLDHLMYITRPDGTTPLFGDEDGGRLTMLDDRPPDDFRATLAVGAVALNRGDYKFIAGDATESLLWLLGNEELERFESIAAKQPAEMSKAFRAGGYFVMRDGWTREANYLLFDCGPHGSLACGHGHADALQILVAARGRTVLIDSGTYTYTGSKELRDWFRSSHAHNTVTLDDESSSVPAGAFSWNTIARCSLRHWISEERFDFVSGEHDGFKRLQSPATVKREILFLKPDYWIIRDTVDSPGSHRVDVRFHLDAEADLVIECFGNGHLVEEKGFVSHCYGQKEPARVLNFSGVVRGGDKVYTFLLPKEGEWKVKETSVADGDGFEVFHGNTHDLVIIQSGKWTVTGSHEIEINVRD